MVAIEEAEIARPEPTPGEGFASRGKHLSRDSFRAIPRALATTSATPPAIGRVLLQFSSVRGPLPVPSHAAQKNLILPQGRI